MWHFFHSHSLSLSICCVHLFVLIAWIIGEFRYMPQKLLLKYASLGFLFHSSSWFFVAHFFCAHNFCLSNCHGKWFIVAKCKNEQNKNRLRCNCCYYWSWIPPGNLKCFLHHYKPLTTENTLGEQFNIAYSWHQYHLKLSNLQWCENVSEKQTILLR